MEPLDHLLLFSDEASELVVGEASMASVAAVVRAIDGLNV